MSGAPDQAKHAAHEFASQVLAQGYRPEALHVYTDAQGSTLYWRIRCKHPDRQEKWIRPMMHNGAGYVLKEPSFPGGKPLYRLHELAARNDEPVVLTEGEKDADALAKRGVLATTSGGASSASAADWTPLAGRHVIVWRDRDAPGLQYAREATERLLALGCRVEWIDIEPLGLPEHGDACEWLAAHPNATAADVLALARHPVAAERGPATADHVRELLDGSRRLAGHRKVNGECRQPFLRSRCIDRIEAKPMDWIWKGRIARGKVTWIAGHPGLGKSQASLSFAAVVSTGGTWPVDRTRCEPGNVVLLSAEDDPADTIRPRLEAAGADLKRCHVLETVCDYDHDGAQYSRAFSLQTDLTHLGALLSELGDVALVIIDPVSAYLGDTDSHKNAEVRALFAPLAELATKFDVAVLCIDHLSKSRNAEALMRVNGSVAFVATARAAWLVTRDPDQKERRLFLPLKNNFGNDQSGLAFGLEQYRLPSGIETCRVVWEAEAVTVTADEALAPAEDPDERSTLEEAKEFLRGLLADAPIPAKRVYAEGRGAGYSERTIRRAQQALNIDAYREGFGKHGGWFWSLAPKAANEPKGVQEKNMDAYEGDGHLCTQPTLDEPDYEVF